MQKISVVFLFSGLLLVAAKAHPGVGVVMDSQGYLYYSDLTQVWQVSPDGKNRRVVVPGVHTHELYVDAQDCLYGEHLWYNGEQKDTWGCFAWEYQINTGTFTNLTGAVEGFNHGYSFCQDERGNMYWVERGNPESKIKKKAPSGAEEVLYQTNFTDVRWQYSTKNGTFYFIDDNDLYKLTPEQQLVLVKENVDGIKKRPKNMINNHSIYGIFDDVFGQVYCAVLSRNEIRKITPLGEMTVIYTSPPGWQPTGGLIDREQQLWVLENQISNNAVRLLKVTKTFSSSQ